jgi:hypothetical protein
MSNSYLALWCDPTTNTLYSGWNNTSLAPVPSLKQGDSVKLEIHWVNSGVNGASMTEVEFPTSATVRLALGLLDTEPNSGTFRITYAGFTTDEIQYNVTAVQLQTVLNAIPEIITEGGVAVTKTSSQFRIVWNEEFETTSKFVCDVGNLSPTSNANIALIKAGTLSARKIILFKLQQAAVAATTAFVKTPDPEFLITQPSTGLFRINLTSAPKGGTFQLQLLIGNTTYTTSVIQSGATNQAVLNAISQAISAIPVANIPQITVSGFGLYGYEIYTNAIGPQEPISQVTVINNIVGFSSVESNLSLNTPEIEELLSGEPSSIVTLEIEVDIAGQIQTLIQTDAIILNDLINATSFTLVGVQDQFGSLMPTDSSVRFDTSQALTTAQKTQARQNIDAVSSSSITGFTTDINVLQGQMSAAQFNITQAQEDILDLEEATGVDIAAAIAPLQAEINAVELSISTNINQVVKTTSNVQFAKVTVLSGANDVQINPTGITFPDDTIQTSAFNATSTAGFVLKANNLSDLESVTTARTNLGLGTMATQTAVDFMRKDANLTGLTDRAIARANLSLGSMATANQSEFLAKQDNLSGLPSAATARNNLGLTAMATEQPSNYITFASNLAGVNVSSARNNLGLGATSAVTHGSLLINGLYGDQVEILNGQIKSFNTFDLSGKQTIIGPSSISLTNTITGITVSNPTGMVSAVGAQGQFGSNWNRRGIYHYEDGSETGIIAEGVVFPDQTIQTTAAVPADYFKISENLADGDLEAIRSNLNIGTAANLSSDAVLIKASNLADVPSKSSARTNLGLGTAATQATTSFYQKNLYLQELATIEVGGNSVAVKQQAARDNLGLGTIATQDSTTFLRTSNILSELTPAQIRNAAGFTDGNSLLLGVGTLSASNVASTSIDTFGTPTSDDTQKGAYDVDANLSMMRSYGDNIFARQFWAWGVNSYSDDDKPAFVIRKPDPNWSGFGSNVSKECIIGWNQEVDGGVLQTDTIQRDFGFWIRDSNAANQSLANSSYNTFVCGLTEKGVQFPDKSYQLKSSISPKIGSINGGLINLAEKNWVTSTSTDVGDTDWTKVCVPVSPSKYINNQYSRYANVNGTHRYTFNTIGFTVNTAFLIHTESGFWSSSTTMNDSQRYWIGFGRVGDSGDYFFRLGSLLAQGDTVRTFADTPTADDIYDIVFWESSNTGTAVGSKMEFVLLKNGIELAAITYTLNNSDVTANFALNKFKHAGLKIFGSLGGTSSGWVSGLHYQCSENKPIKYKEYWAVDNTTDKYIWPF